jgi:hypothetical protein
MRMSLEMLFVHFNPVRAAARGAVLRQVRKHADPLVVGAHLTKEGAIWLVLGRCHSVRCESTIFQQKNAGCTTGNRICARVCQLVPHRATDKRGTCNLLSVPNVPI